MRRRGAHGNRPAWGWYSLVASLGVLAFFLAAFLALQAAGR
jgi:hypothetical protein